MAATLRRDAGGREPDGIAAALRTFPGVEHRLEFVRERNGVDITTIRKPPTWTRPKRRSTRSRADLWIILGGKDKNSDYTVLREKLAAKGKGVLLIGAAAPKIAAQLEGLPLVRIRDASIARWNCAASQASAGRYRPAGAGLRQLRSVREFRASRASVQGTGKEFVEVAQRLKTDWILFFTIVAMVCFGLVIVYSASSVMAELKYKWDMYFIVRQIGWAVVSFVVLMQFKRLDYRRFDNPVWAFAPLAL